MPITTETSCLVAVDEADGRWELRCGAPRETPSIGFIRGFVTIALFPERPRMRLALIADIHGNLHALETVLTEIARANVDQTVCLSDIAVLGPEPGRVIARLRELDIPTVLGNTDAWLLPRSPFPVEPATTRPVADLTRWTSERLSPDDRDFVRSLPLIRHIPLSNRHSIVLFHASPRSLDDVITATTPPDSLTAMIGSQSAAVLIGGHTHIQLLRRHGERRLINPGSVGLPGVGPGTPDLPTNTDVAWAEYAIITIDDVTCSIEFRQTPLDLAAMRKSVIDRGMPHGDWWFSRWRSF